MLKQSQGKKAQIQTKLNKNGTLITGRKAILERSTRFYYELYTILTDFAETSINLNTQEEKEPPITKKRNHLCTKKKLKKQKVRGMMSQLEILKEEMQSLHS